jgi:dienelactone hydrolase
MPASRSGRSRRRCFLRRVRVPEGLAVQRRFPGLRIGLLAEGVPLQIHMMEDDEWACEDLPAAHELVESIEDAPLFLYPGDGHLFADNSLSEYDEGAAKLLKQRVFAFLKGVV